MIGCRASWQLLLQVRGVRLLLILDRGNNSDVTCCDTITAQYSSTQHVTVITPESIVIKIHVYQGHLGLYEEHLSSEVALFHLFGTENVFLPPDLDLARAAFVKSDENNSV